MNDRIVILIIDDIEVNRVILKGIFENDYDVIEAENGAQALEILDNGIKVDVILLDIIMPVMDGIDFLKNIKSDKRYCDIPIVVNTQAGEQENEYKALVLGADDFIAKPYEPKIVKRRITNIITKNPIRILYWRLRYAIAPWWMDAEIFFILSLPSGKRSTFCALLATKRSAMMEPKSVSSAN